MNKCQMCHNTGKTVITKFSTAGVVKYDTMQTDCSVCIKPPHTKAGRPKKPNKKQTKTIRLYPSDIAAITAQHDTIQKWINKVVKQISEIK
jgi:hypothetical protein